MSYLENLEIGVKFVNDNYLPLIKTFTVNRIIYS